MRILLYLVIVALLFLAVPVLAADQMPPNTTPTRPEVSGHWDGQTHSIGDQLALAFAQTVTGIFHVRIADGKKDAPKTRPLPPPVQAKNYILKLDSAQLGVTFKGDPKVGGQIVFRAKGVIFAQYRITKKDGDKLEAIVLRQERLPEFGESPELQ